MFESQPLAKLFALWTAPASTWAKYGLQSPAGSGDRAYIDIIPHELDADALRELAPRIPFELVEEYLFVGSPVEVAERLRKYADAGLQHVVMLNLTGLVGGLEEAVARSSDLGMLGQLVKGQEAPMAQRA